MGPNEFTDRESQIMALAWLCMEGDPKVDIKKLAGLAGMTNAGSASNAWAKIKKKLAARALEVTGDADPTNIPSTTSTPKPKATPRKRAKSEDEDDNETPTKKTKAKATPKGRGKKAAGEEEISVPVKTEHDVAEGGSEGDEGIF